MVLRQPKRGGKMATKKAKRIPKKTTKTPRERYSDLRQELRSEYYELDAEIEGILVALLAREHLLFLGPPGTAKTSLTTSVTRAIKGADLFRYLFNKFTEPNEVFGPMSLQSLQADKQKRITTGKLPESSVAFLDECFKANSSILNALLGVLNDRKFDNDGEQDCPLETAIGASNELPESKELDALYDRFLLRYWTDAIKDRSNMKALLMSGGSPCVSSSVTLDELHTMQDEVDEVDISEEIVDLLLDIKAALEKEGYSNSDRRWCKVLGLLQAKAYLEGRDEVCEDDVLILKHALWRDPNHRGKMGQIITHLANPLAHAAERVLDAARERFRTVPIGEEIDDSRKSTVFAQIVEVNAELKAMVTKLQKMSNGRRPAVIDEAIEEIVGMQEDVSRYGQQMVA
jgi:MoxR-like ATPase